MKKYIALLITVVSVVPFTAITAHAAPGVRVPLIRLYNARTNDHLYTSSRVEAVQAGAVGYRIEGEMGYLYEQGQFNGQSEAVLYRLLNPRNGKHFYTTSGQENAAATASGYISEGIVGVLPGSTTEYSLDIFRLYNRKQDNHFYTTNVSERDTLLSAGYISEGVLAGVLFTSSAGSSINVPMPTVQTDFIMTSSPSAVFTLGVYKSVVFSFQYKGPDGAQPVVAYNGMPADLTGSIISPTKVNNNDSFTFTISGMLNTSLSTTVPVTIYSSTGFSKIFNISLSTASPPIQSPTIITTQLPAGTVGQQYSTYINFSNPTNKVLNASMANMPDGLGFSGSSFPSATVVVGNTVYLTGTPTRAGNFAAVLTVSDGASVVTQNYNIAISPAISQPTNLSSSDGWLNLYTDSIPAGTVGANYSTSVNFTRYRGNAVSVTVTGLPSGLSIFGGNVFTLPVGQNGFTISGTPTAIGAYTVNVTMTDGISTVGRNYTLMIGQ